MSFTRFAVTAADPVWYCPASLMLALHPDKTTSILESLLKAEYLTPAWLERTSDSCRNSSRPPSLLLSITSLSRRQSITDRHFLVEVVMQCASCVGFSTELDLSLPGAWYQLNTSTVYVPKVPASAALLTGRTNLSTVTWC
jgi:hypothetical protein